MSPETHVKPAPHDQIRRVYVWDSVVRGTHWLIALSLLVLSATGIYIGYPFLVVVGQARDHFVTGTIRAVHLYAGIAFAVSLLARFFWLFAGPPLARWDQFIPVDLQRRKEGREVLGFYLFLRKHPPLFVGHNPLAGATYAVVWGICVLMVVTGVGLHAVDARPGWFMHGFAFIPRCFGGIAYTRLIHHAGMWLLWGFFAHHVFSAREVGTYEKNGIFESIITGFKWLPKKPKP
jgi:Ni/Fe-hydrogenase 1 B-type cytochrome subunit